MAAITAALMLTACLTGQTVERERRIASDIVTLSESIARETNSAARANSMVELKYKIEALAAIGHVELVPEGTIDVIISGLPDRASNLTACWTLEHLGPRALRAIPVIEATITSLRAEETSTAVFPLGGRSLTLVRMEACLATIKAAAEERDRS